MTWKLEFAKNYLIIVRKDNLIVVENRNVSMSTPPPPPPAPPSSVQSVVSQLTDIFDIDVTNLFISQMLSSIEPFHEQNETVHHLFDSAGDSGRIHEE